MRYQKQRPSLSAYQNFLSLRLILFVTLFSHYTMSYTKTLLTAVMLLISSLSAPAQKWNIGYGGGYLYNRFSVNDYRSSPHHGFKMEAVVDYAFSPTLTFSSGLGFSQKGGTIKGEKIGGVNHVTKVEAYPMSYLSLPLLAGYRLKIGKFTLLPQAGFYFGVGVGGKGQVEGRKATGEAYREKMNLFNAPDVTPHSHFNCFDFGTTVALNLTFEQYRLKAYYEHSLHEMNSLWGDPRHRSVGLSFMLLLHQ